MELVYQWLALPVWLQMSVIGLVVWIVYAAQTSRD